MLVHFRIYKYVSFRLIRKPYPELCQISTIYDGVRYWELCGWYFREWLNLRLNVRRIWLIRASKFAIVNQGS